MTSFDPLLPWLGGLLVTATAIDVFLTVLHPGSGAGLISRTLFRIVGAAFRAAGKPLSAPRRQRLLSFTGPVLLTLSVAVWFCLLSLGGAMVYKPALGDGIVSTNGTAAPDWATALYFSSFNLTTLGVGDIVPVQPTYRLLTAGQAALGFAFFSLSTAYALVVYSTLADRNTALQALHDMSGRTADAVTLLERLLSGLPPQEVAARLAAKAQPLRGLEQTLTLYPVLAYFHFHAPAHALPQSLRLLLDSVALLVSMLDPVRHREALRSCDLDEAWIVALSLGQAVLPDHRLATPSPQEERDWRQHHARACARLRGVGLALREDEDAGAEHYLRLRRQWNPLVARMSDELLYDWNRALRDEDRLAPLERP